MDDIAEQLDLTKAALYYYCDSKEDLFVKVIEARIGTAVTALEELEGRDGPASDKIRDAIALHLEVFHQHRDIYTMFLSERVRSISRDASGIVDRLGRRFEAIWAGLLEDGIRSGEFRADLDVPVTVKASLSMCNMTLTWFRPDGRLDIDGLADRFAGLLLEGITS